METKAMTLRAAICSAVVLIGADRGQADELVVSGTLTLSHTTPVLDCGSLNCSSTQSTDPFTVTAAQFPPGLGVVTGIRLEATPAAGGLFAWIAASTCGFAGICVNTTVSLVFTGPGLSLTAGVTLPDACDTMTPQHCSGQFMVPAAAGATGVAQVAAGARPAYIGEGDVNLTVRFTFTENVANSNSSHPVFWQELIETATPIRLVYTYTPTPPCPADWNGDGAVDSADISAYLVAWLASVTEGTLAADFNADGAVNSSDISAYLVGWLEAVNGGC